MNPIIKTIIGIGISFFICIVSETGTEASLIIIFGSIGYCIIRWLVYGNFWKMWPAVWICIFALAATGVIPQKKPIFRSLYAKFYGYKTYESKNSHIQTANFRPEVLYDFPKTVGFETYNDYIKSEYRPPEIENFDWNRMTDSDKELQRHRYAHFEMAKKYWKHKQVRRLLILDGECFGSERFQQYMVNHELKEYRTRKQIILTDPTIDDKSMFWDMRRNAHKYSDITMTRIPNQGNRRYQENLDNYNKKHKQNYIRYGASNP